MRMDHAHVIDTSLNLHGQGVGHQEQEQAHGQGIPISTIFAAGHVNESTFRQEE